MADTSRRYRGFISYSQADKRFAKKLHRALEGFTLPGGRKLGRFFRDDDELGGAASLGAALEGAIGDSEDLIVIASPNSARSKWVNEEVIHYKRKADPNKQVFAVVIDGAPGGHGGAKECFVPALKSKVALDGTLTGEPDEPLAPDARKEPFGRLVTKLVAGLEGIPFDDLWQRQKRRARMRALATAAVLVAVAAPLAWWGLTASQQLEARETQLQSLDTETQRLTFLDAYFAHLQDRQWAQGETDPAYMISRERYDEGVGLLAASDLNADGYQDYYVRIEHIDFCGSGGCLHEIMVHEAGGYRSVHQSNGGDLQVLTTEQNGYRDLALGFGGAGDSTTAYTALRYDGEHYVAEAYALCSGVISYCGLSTVFTDAPVGETLDMVFRAVDEAQHAEISDRVDRSAIYDSGEAARGITDGETLGEFFDYVAGVDDTGQFALVHIWKGTYGVARLTPP